MIRLDHPLGAEPDGYAAEARARWADEPPKDAARAARGVFVRDRARVLHSAALRRLAAKTQVVEVGTGDFPRTRLTHSLECAQIGRELGAALGCDADLVDAACLAHDIGHPPFGHNGETALAELAAGCGGFEGNAQSLRLLTRLEAKVPGAGLNLTRATLDATLKYPWLRQAKLPRGPGLPADTSRKFGAYADDQAAFDWIRAAAAPAVTCLEAQVMDWADDVAYSVHDLEDGLHAGLIGLSQLRDPAERQVVAELTITNYLPGGSADLAELTDTFTALMRLDRWPRKFDGSQASAAAVKSLTSMLIGRFCAAAEQATRSAGAPALTRYAAALQVPRQQRLECALLKGVTAQYVMGRAGAAAVQQRERELITELSYAVLTGAPDTLDPMLRPAFAAAADDAARLRVVVDQVASLTDTSAVAWHKRLC